jgi:aromatic-L-amino-acid decarboxylase
MAALNQPLPERGVGLDQVLRELAETIIPYGLRIGSPGFCGWVTTAPTTAGTASSLAATVAGSQRYWVQPFNYLETIALRWLAELLGLPSDWQGVFTSGGSVANLIGLGAARQHAFERIGHDPARDGLPPDSRWRIYASSEVHHVVNRAAGVLGLGRRAVASIAVDTAQRMDLDHLRKALEADRARGILPVAFVASAGTVNTGAIDPIEQIVEIASKNDAWLHIDGAYGLFGVLDSRVAPLFRGLERADSVTVDPHKWLAAPVGCGAVFVRDQALLGRAFTMEPAEYLEGAVGVGTGQVQSPFDDFGELYHHFGVEASTPSRGVQVWAILREIGAEGMRERVMRHNDFARHLSSRVQEDDRLELLALPTLSICCFRYRPPQLEETELDELNAEIARRLRAEGAYVPSTTRVAGKLAIRPCYINPRTSLAEVNGLADRVRQIGDSLVFREIRGRA